MTIVNVVTWDRAGLFYKLAGALSLAGVNISNTRAISRGDHISIDTFYVMDPQGGRVTQTQTKEVFEHHLNDCLMHGKELLPAITELEARIKQNKPKERHLAPFPRYMFTMNFSQTHYFRSSSRGSYWATVPARTRSHSPWIQYQLRSSGNRTRYSHGYLLYRKHPT